MTGCTIGGAVTQPAKLNEKSKTDGDKGVKLPLDPTDTSTPISTVTKPPIPSSNVRPDGACALPSIPHGEREDSQGIRFGLQSGSRLEFDRVPHSFDSNIIFSIQLRATAANGILMFVTNEKHSDFMALYMQEGRIVFTYGSGNARVSFILYFYINLHTMQLNCDF